VLLAGDLCTAFVVIRHALETFVLHDETAPLGVDEAERIPRCTLAW
jgi:hypothetical protein